MPFTRRAALACAIAIVALAGPGSAAAHPRGPAVALDVRLRLASAPAGVDATVIDGDRELRLRADPSLRLVVRGLLGEPFLRFDSSGVWVNRRSPTAAANRLVRAREAGPQWRRETSGHAFMWHDHRLAPPPHLAAGSSAPWSLPLTVNGRGAELTGSFLRVRRPRVWPWLAGLAALIGLLWLAALRLPRSGLATGLAGVAALAALAADAGYATGDAISRAGRWVEVGAAAVLALVALGALLIGDRSVRGWVTCIVGAVAGALGLGSLSVFLHGVVISTLPATAARLATGIALAAGFSAAVLAIAAEPKAVRR